ncbi:hypothetical protein MCOR19_008788 [Pyricularia oryzae]|nr:hypothetical protein MCOR19_008788 [Pyricularia oryzae]
MSQYASGHGQWPIDPSGFYPYPTNPPQTQQRPTSYHNTSSEPSSSASYLTSQNSFGYNSTQIPGLGFGGPSASASNGPTPQPHQQSWIPPPQPPANYQQQVSNAPATTLESAKTSFQPDLLPKPPVQNTQEGMEEGELSDADFDDLYDPQPDDVAQPQPSTVNQKPRPVDHVRQNSYSPHLSPNEVGRPQLPSTVLNGSSQSTKPSLPGLGLQKNPDTVDDVPAQPVGAVPQFRSVDEAKKEAQKSILRLLPLGVKYQTYLDEGFDEATVKSLFNELNLLPPSIAVKPVTQPVTAAKPVPNSVAVPDKNTPAPKDKTEERKDRIARLLAAKAANKTTSTPAAPSKPSTTSPAPTQSPVPVSAGHPPDVGTLAVAPTGPSIPSGPAAMQNAPPPSAPTAPLALRKEMDSVAKPKFKADKEALLKKKLEALKSRQAQKQLAATTQTTPPAVDSGSSISRPSVPSITIPAGSTVNPVHNTPAGGQSNMGSSPSVLNAQTGSSIPGLSLSTGNLGSASSRKRPVAADFVDYSATVGTPKRPYGQHRQDSFVIDISEDSDDDVEMEVDSPGGHSESSSSRVETPNQGPVVRDFPPLSDGTPRKSLTRSNSNVPPAKLSRLDSDILRMRAKIAAAEAKKRMAGSGSQTPDVTTSTPELKEPPTRLVDPAEHTRTTAPGQRAVSFSDIESTDLPSAQLISEAASASVPRFPEQTQGTRSMHGYGQLKVATAPPVRPATQAAAAGEGDRRARITSVQLPKIEAKLLEKKTKLKLLEQKAAQLRREIETEAAEREKLAEELRQLEVEPTDSDPPSQSVMQHQEQQPVGQESDAQLPQPSVEAQEPTESRSAQVSQTSPSAPLADALDSEPMQVDTGKMTVEELVSAQESPKEKAIEPATAASVNSTEVDDQTLTGPTEDAPFAPKSPVQSVSASKESPQIDVVMASTTSTPESGQIEESAPASPRDTNSGSTSSDESQLNFETTPAPATETISRERAEGSPDMPMISDVVHANDDTERTVDVNGEVNTVFHPSERGSSKLTCQQAPTDPKDEVPSFTPYESPLTYFRAYRFHPKYAETVTGGLKSLTYTNKINPKQALCLNELTQKKCNDPECGFQHFKSMVPRGKSASHPYPDC